MKTYILENQGKGTVSIQPEQLKKIAGATTSSGSGIQSIQEGDNISIDNTDPLNPIVSALGGEGSAPEFAKITEGANTGWGLKYRVDNPDRYGDIGNNAIDLSFNDSGISTLYGAKGIYTFAIGYKNSAIGESSFVANAFNTEEGGRFNTIFGLGGTAKGRTVFISGEDNTITGDNDVTTIASFIGGGYQNEINNSGYSTILGGRTNTIENSSSSFIASSYRGKIENGNYSSIISSTNIAENQDTKVLSYYSTIISGLSATAQSYGEVVMGSLNTLYTPASTSTWNSSDRLLNIGNGTYASPTISRSDALILYKSGLLTLPSLTTTMIDAEPTGKAVVTKEYVNQANSYSTTEIKTGGTWVDNKPLYKKTQLTSDPAPTVGTMIKSTVVGGIYTEYEYTKP